MEHFGISVVEAMAAGAVPLAVGKGGVREIIRQSETGILWNTPAELVAATRQLIEDPERRARLSAAARQHSREFSQERYGDAMQQIRAAACDQRFVSMNITSAHARMLYIAAGLRSAPDDGIHLTVPIATRPDHWIAAGDHRNDTLLHARHIPPHMKFQSASAISHHNDPYSPNWIAQTYADV